MKSSYIVILEHLWDLRVGMEAHNGGGRAIRRDGKVFSQALPEAGGDNDAEQILLQSTRLNLVVKMARAIAGGIWFGVRMITWNDYTPAGISPVLAR